MTGIGPVAWIGALGRPGIVEPIGGEPVGGVAVGGVAVGGDAVAGTGMRGICGRGNGWVIVCELLPGRGAPGLAGPPAG
jgi:hypothetical protein